MELKYLRLLFRLVFDEFRSRGLERRISERRLIDGFEDVLIGKYMVDRVDIWKGSGIGG